MLTPTHSPGSRDGTHVDVGNLLPVVAVQPVPQQGLLWELAGGRHAGSGLTPGLSALLASPALASPGSLDLLDLPVRRLALLLQNRPVGLTRHPAAFLL